MDLAGRNVWQVAAGDNKRRYDDICLEYDVMMIGSGELGPFDENTYRDKKDSSKNAIRRFYRELKLGDLVLLRLGTREVLAVGEVAGDQAAHMEEFGDIDGWRLQHTRRVRWVRATKQFAGSKFRGRFGGVWQPEVLEWVRAFRYPVETPSRTLLDLPMDTGKLSDEELGAQLAENGMPVQRVARLLATMESVRPLIEWYRAQQEKRSGRPSEHETITYLVVPLLFSLGWSEKTLAIEWRSMDMALFDEAGLGALHPACAIEVKSLDKSVFAPKEQAVSYAEREHCERFFVTDGVRYACFRKEADEYVPGSYLNITRLRHSYPAYHDRARGHCGGAVDSLLSMARSSHASEPPALTDENHPQHHKPSGHEPRGV